MVHEWPCPKCGRVFSLDLNGAIFPYMARCSGCQHSWEVADPREPKLLQRMGTGEHAGWWE